MNWVTIIGYAATVAGCAMSIAPWLSIRRILKTRSSKDISLGYVAVIINGATVYALYGFALHNWFLIIPNLVGIVTNVVFVFIVRHFRPGKAEVEIEHPTGKERIAYQEIHKPQLALPVGASNA